MGRTDFYRALGPERGAWFDDTNWSVVRQAGQVGLPGADAAQAALYRTYWRPIYAYICRRGYTHADAQDLAQEFLVRLLERNYLRAAAPAKGRFRTYLLTLLNRFLADQHRRATRQKRGGQHAVLSLDEGDTEARRRREPADSMTPDKCFDRAWAESLLTNALALLERECLADGKQQLFAELKPFLTCDSHEPSKLAADRLGLTQGNLRVTLHRLRQRFRELLRAEIAHTARTREEIEAELDDLRAVLSEGA